MRVPSRRAMRSPRARRTRVRVSWTEAAEAAANTATMVLRATLVMGLHAATALSAAQPPRPAAAAWLMADAVVRVSNSSGCIAHSSKLDVCAFSRWSYGNSIILDSMLYAARHAPAPGGTTAASVAFVDAQLDSFVRSEGSVAWNLTRNIVRKVGFGEIVDIFPFVYLSRAEFHRAAGFVGSGLAVAAAGAKGVLSWPKR